MPLRREPGKVLVVTPFDMALECKRVLESEQGLRFVAFVVPRKPRGASRLHLAGKGSPLGEISCVNSDGHTVCRFDPIDVLAWLAANEMVPIEIVRRTE